MRDEYNSFNKLMNNLWQEASCGSMRSIFLHTSSSADFSNYVNAFLDGIGQDAAVFRTDMNSIAPGPYLPFLKMLREWASNAPAPQMQKAISEAQVYFSHEEIITSYITGRELKRNEVIIPEELDYEIQMIKQSVWRLFTRAFSGKPMIVIIEQLQHAPVSTIEFIKMFIAHGEDTPSPFLFIFSLDRDYKMENEINQILWDNFIKELESNMLITEFKRRKDTTSYLKDFQENVPLDEMIDTGRDFFYMLALRDAQLVLSNAHKISASTLQHTSEYNTYDMLSMLGDVYLYLNDADNALTIYHQMLNHSQHCKNSYWICVSNCKIGSAYLKKENIDTAEKFAKQSIKIANDLGNDQLLFAGNFLLYLLEDKGRKQSISVWRKSYNALIKLTLKLGYKNIYSYIVTNPYGVYSDLTEENEKLHSEGIDIAVKNKNWFRVAGAYQTRGMVYSVKGRYDRVLEFYQQSKKIKYKLGNKLEISYINNGMGFFYYLTGDYISAHQHYHQALDTLQEIKDFHEIGMTLFNLAANSFMAFEHRLAIDYLEKCLILIKTIGMKNLAYHSLFGIYSLIGVNYCKNGNYTKAYQYLNRIKVMELEPFPEKNEEYFHYNMLLALIKIYEGEYSEAEDHFAESLVYLQKTNDNIKYLGPRYYFELSQYYKLVNDKRNYEKSVRDGLKASGELNYKTYSNIFGKISEISTAEEIKVRLTIIKFEFDWIVYAAKMENNLIALHKKIDEIHFINTFQSLCGRENTENSLITNTINFIHNSIPADSVLYVRRMSKAWKIIYRKSSINFPDTLNLVPLVKLMSKKTTPLYIEEIDLIDELNGLDLPVRSVISLPVGQDGAINDFILCLTQRGHVTLLKDDLEVLTIASRQMHASLIKIDQGKEIIETNKKLRKANQKLAAASTTDFLTCLGNRSALMDRLESETERLRRRKNKDEHFTLLFIDLDNFKHYNDTFGHHIGDFILVKFAEILKKQSRKSDTSFRYGGDEFVIVLPDTPKRKSVELAKRILKSFKPDNSFMKSLQQAVGLFTNIPEDKRLTCSIGISQLDYQDAGEENIVTTLINHADMALYRSKHKGKNTFSIYDKD